MLLRTVGKWADMILWSVLVIGIRDETEFAHLNIGLKWECVNLSTRLQQLGVPRRIDIAA